MPAALLMIAVRQKKPLFNKKKACVAFFLSVGVHKKRTGRRPLVVAIGPWACAA